MKRYDKAIELYKKYGLMNNVGMIYYKYKKEYLIAFKYFHEIHNYKFALNSLIKTNNLKRAFDYTNEIASYLGIIEYNKIYKEYINSFFRKYIFERKRLNEIINLNKFTTNNNLTNKDIINEFFLQYLNTLENFVKDNSLMQIHFNEKAYNEIKEELKLDLETKHFIDTYYFNIPSNILFEFLKIFPELIYFKSKSFNIEKHIDNLRKEKNSVINEKTKLNKMCEAVINFILQNSKSDIKKFIKYIIQFLFSHGFFYLKLDEYFPRNIYKIKLFLDLSLNFDLQNNEIIYRSLDFIESDNNYLLYYLSYLLRKGITDFNKNKDKNIILNYILFKYPDFNYLNNLINLLKYEAIDDIKNKKLKTEVNYDKKNINSLNIKYENINENLSIFLNYLKEEEDPLNKEEIYKYLDIGSSLSLFIILLDFKEKYTTDMVLESELLFDLFNNLYMLCNLLSSKKFIETFSYEKKLILFSLFSAFYASPLPSNNYLFKIYDNINGCLINENSILFNTDYLKYNYFEIFSKLHKLLFKNNSFQMFNLEGNNIIVNYNILSSLFRFMIKTLIESIFNNSKGILDKTPNIYNRFYNIPEDGHYYSSILFYQNQFYELYIDNIIKNDSFWEALGKALDIPFIFNYFPALTKKNEAFNYLNNYLKNLIIYKNVKPNTLYSVLINYFHKQKETNHSINKNDSNLLIFLLIDIWNISLDSNIINDKYLKYCYLDKFDYCLKIISKAETYIFSSLIILRRTFPLILKIYQLYFDKGNEDYIKTDVYSYDDENIFEQIRDIDILKEKKKTKKSLFLIIRHYFLALETTMIKFSCMVYNKEAKDKKDNEFKNNINNIDIESNNEEEYIIKCFNDKFYEFGVEMFEKKYEDNLIKTRSIEYFSEYYYLFELSFFCFYLSVINLYNIIKNDKEYGNIFGEEEIIEYCKIRIKKVNTQTNQIENEEEEEEEEENEEEKEWKMKEMIYALKRFISIYEKYSLYLYFMEDKDNVKNNYNFDTKKFKFHNSKEFEITHKKVKFVKDGNLGKLSDIDKKLLFDSFNENKDFYKNQNIKKFYKKINYDSIDRNQRFKILKNYFDNYLELVNNLN